MPTLQKLYRSTLYILAWLIVSRLADSSFIIKSTTIPIIVDQHLECNKLETLTPAQVQNMDRK